MWDITEKVIPEFAEIGYELWEDEDFMVIQHNGVKFATVFSLGATAESIKDLIRKHEYEIRAPSSTSLQSSNEGRQYD